jgi:hypothetical protein
MLAAVGEVKLGRSVSVGGPIEYRVTADNPEPARHKMTQTGDSAPGDRKIALLGSDGNNGTAPPAGSRESLAADRPGVSPPPKRSALLVRCR